MYQQPSKSSHLFRYLIQQSALRRSPNCPILNVLEVRGRYVNDGTAVDGLLSNH